MSVPQILNVTQRNQLLKDHSFLRKKSSGNNQDLEWKRTIGSQRYSVEATGAIY